MKRRYLLTVAAALILGSQLFVTCSNPLERDDDPDPNPPIHDTLFDTVFLTDSVTDTLIIYDSTTITDTVTVVDTLELSDTVFVVDTVFEGDTITIVDTLFEVDTITVVDTVELSDTTCFRTICDTLSKHSHKISWTFADMGGNYLLMFEATVLDTQPPKELIVSIEGQEHIWPTEQSLVFSVETTLGDYATIEIFPDNPTAFGHYVHICLTFGTP